MMKMICLGDSLTYGLGMSVTRNWVALLDKDSPYQVENKGISGDTSGGMLARLHRDVLDTDAETMFLMGGANDFIMGCDIPVVKANIMAMAHQAYAAKKRVIISAEISSDIANIREDWRSLADFEAVDQKVRQMAEWLPDFCHTFQIPFINLHKHFHEEVAGHESDYFFDGVHPNKQGHRLIADILLNHGIRNGEFE